MFEPGYHYAFTFTIKFFFKLPALNVILALPVTFFALMVNVTSPFALVTALVGETDTHFFPALSLFIVTSIFATGHSSSPVNFTVTSYFFLPFNFSVLLEGLIDLSSQTAGVGVGVATTVIVGTGGGVGSGPGKVVVVVLVVVVLVGVVLVVVVVVLVVVVVAPPPPPPPPPPPDSVVVVVLVVVVVVVATVSVVKEVSLPYEAPALLCAAIL